MFDFIGNHKKLVQLVLALITLPFAFFGVDYYFRQNSSIPEVATVGGQKITQAEFNDSLTEQQERVRQQMGRSYDPTMFDSPEVRYALLDQLVAQKLMQEKARQENFRVNDAQLQKFIAAVPAFQYDGNFSPERYQAALSGQNTTPLVFEDRLRRELVVAPLQESLANDNIVAASSGEHYLGLLEQKREVAMVSIDPASYIKEVKVDDAAIKAYYDANTASLQSPEEAKFEYLILSQDALMNQIIVDAADVKSQYDHNQNLYGKPEERDASHILITVKADASDADKAVAKKKAEDLAAQAKANPAKFADLAKQNSQDPGSAAQGGDLGPFGRGSMVKPFEDAVFAMKPGEIVGPIKSDFGYHVIKLNSILPAQVKPFDEVKTQIETELRRQKASQKFAAEADQFQNLVYEQADSLQGAAKTLGLTVQTSGLITRPQAQAVALGSAKFIQTLFSPESVQSKRNTEAIEVAPNTLMSGRIIEYKPAAVRPFDEVKEEVRQRLILKEASAMAQKVGREKLALLEQGKSDKDVGLSFAAPVTLTRDQVQKGYTPEALTKIFQADAAHLPQFTGTVNGVGGFSIYKLLKVTSPEQVDVAKINSANSQIGEQIGREVLQAYINGLKAKTEIKINQANLEKKQQ